MALKIALKPGEKVAINGAVIVNGDRRTSFVLQNKARVLREGDIMQPGEADSPAKLIYLAVMMLYLEETPTTALKNEYEKRLNEFVDVVTDPKALEECAALAAHVANSDFYKALNVCCSLIEFEKTRLDYVA